MPDKTYYPTLGYHLYENAQAVPDKEAFIFGEDSLTYKVLYEKASTLAVELLRKAKKGDRALLVYAPSLDFSIAFFACTLAGLIAVPCYPPANAVFSKKLSVIIQDCNPKLILTTSSLYWRLLAGKSLAYLKPFLGPMIPKFFAKIDEEFFHEMSTCRLVLTDKVVKKHTEIPISELSNVEGKDLAFLQYTSGSTGQTKGVMVAHSNIMANLSDLEKFFPISNKYRGLIWLPHYHDLGLVTGYLIPVVSQGCGLIMSPFEFIKSPLNWLKKISRLKATTSGGPTFAYNLCLKIDDSELHDLDLSSWDCAFCGAEPIRQDILHKFTKKFERFNFNPQIFHYSYGLAESVVYLASGKTYATNETNNFDPKKLYHEQKAEPTNSEKGICVVSCGPWPQAQTVKIVHPETHMLLEDGQVGKIMVSSPSVCQGYWNKPELSEKVFRVKLADGKEYLDTGDQGFVLNNELFVTGRFKEILIIHGINYNPEPIERMAESQSQKIHTGGVAAIQVNNVDEDTLTLFVEIRSKDVQELTKIGLDITAAVLSAYSLKVRKIYFVNPKFIPKTTSGKIARFKLQDKLESPDILLIFEENRVENRVKETTEPLPERTFKDIHLLAKNLTGQQIRKQDRIEDVFRDSLTLMQLLSQMEISLGCEDLPYSLLTRSRNFEELIDKSIEWVKAHEKMDVEEGLHQEEWLPATPMAKMIVEWMGLNREFNLAYVCDLKKEVSLEELTKALAKLVQLQPYLSSAYIKEKNAFKVMKDLSVEKFLEHQIVSIDEEKMKSYLEKCISETSDALSIEKAPLFKALFIENNQEKKKHLILVISHLIADPYSLGLWFEQLEILLSHHEEKEAKLVQQINQEMKKVGKAFSLEAPPLKEIHHAPKDFSLETFHRFDFDKQMIDQMEHYLKQQGINIDAFLMGISTLALKQCGLVSEKVQFIHNGRTIIDPDHPLRHLCAWLNLSWPIQLPSEDKEISVYLKKLNDLADESLKQALVANQKTWYESRDPVAFDPYAAQIEYSRIGFHHFHTPQGVFATSSYFLDDYLHGKTFSEELPRYRKAFVRPVIHKEYLSLLFFLSESVETQELSATISSILEEIFVNSIIV